MRRIALNFISEGKVSEKVMNDIITSDNTRRTLTAESKSVIDKQLEALQATEAVYNNQPAVKAYDITKDKAITSGNVEQLTEPAFKNEVKSKLQAALQVKHVDDKVFNHFINWLIQTYPTLDTPDNIKVLQKKPEMITQVANEFGAIYNTKTTQGNEKDRLRAAQAQESVNKISGF